MNLTLDLPLLGAEETEIGFGGYYLTYATLMANVRILPSGSWGVSIYLYWAMGYTLQLNSPHIYQS